MIGLLPAPEDRGIVVFRVIPSMNYSERLMISFAAIWLGLLWQFFSMTLLPGVVIVFVGNLFLITRGYDNRVDAGTYTAEAQWQTVTIDKLRELKELERKMKDWDRSLLDISNGWGLASFCLLAILVFLGYQLGKTDGSQTILLLSVNLAVLLAPHWVTGIRSILTRPNLMLKVDALLRLIERSGRRIAPDKIEIQMLVKGEGKGAMPSDVRIAVKPEGSDSAFLGLQGQISLNMVQGKAYVYFYVVLVARREYGLNEMVAGWDPPHGVVKEYSGSAKEDVDVLVIRQHTTKKSGYHTKDRMVTTIFENGYALARKVCSR